MLSLSSFKITSCQCVSHKMVLDLGMLMIAEEIPPVAAPVLRGLSSHRCDGRPVGASGLYMMTCTVSAHSTVSIQPDRLGMKVEQSKHKNVIDATAAYRAAKIIQEKGKNVHWGRCGQTYCPNKYGASFWCAYFGPRASAFAIQGTITVCVHIVYRILLKWNIQGHQTCQGELIKHTGPFFFSLNWQHAMGKCNAFSLKWI